jgi:hypothetical protein
VRAHADRHLVEVPCSDFRLVTRCRVPALLARELRCSPASGLISRGELVHRELGQLLLLGQAVRLAPRVTIGVTLASGLACTRISFCSVRRLVRGLAMVNVVHARFACWSTRICRWHSSWPAGTLTADGRG